MALESIETKSFTIKDIINEAIKEETKLKEEINNKLPDEIGGYKILSEYSSFLKKDEKGFAMILSQGDYGPDDREDVIIVKYKKGKLIIRNTVEEPYTDEMFDEINLDPNEMTENQDANKINKFIKTLGYTPLTNKNGDLNKLLKLIEDLEK